MTSLTIYSTKDSRILEDTPDGNYGTSTFIEVDVDSSTGHIIRSFAEFSLSSLIDVPIDNISSASLYLFCLSASGTPRIIDIRLIDSAWTETGVTWNNQPTSLDYNVEHTWPSGSAWNNVSIISILKDVLRDGGSSMGLLLKYLDEVADGTKDGNSFSSREGSFDPYIQIEYSTYSQTALHGSLCKNLLFKDGFGEITMTDHNCPSPCDAATFTFKTAWGSTYTTVLLDVGDTQQYDSGSMHHSFKLYSMTASSAPCDNLAAATIEEKYWEDDCYVKTTGDNDRNGTSWTEAWDTVTQAATEAFDGQEVHIGFGTYSGESKTVPDNFGTTGIKYTPEAVGGGGSGSVTVPQ
ncbi:DNRLRE domain-containing protein [Candidatus Calescamantes bacterium]|nr:DNRLRE domain-containing protein [Candidatus Calescamantes bacterium]